MRNSTLLCRRGFLGIASEMLEILMKISKRIFNYNLFPCSPCGPWMFLGLLTQEILEEIFLKNGRRPEINQFYYNFKL